MKHFLVFLSLLSTFSLSAQDWLIDGSSYKSTAQTTHDGKRLGLTNGLLRRTFLLAPNAATIALDNLMTGQNELRAVRPEALLVINGKEYPVGGLTGQPVNNFLTEEFINNMQACDSAFMLVDYQISESKERFPWKPNSQWIFMNCTTVPLSWPNGSRSTIKEQCLLHSILSSQKYSLWSKRLRKYITANRMKSA